MTITDEYMQEMMSRTRSYTLVFLKDGPNRGGDDDAAVIWEHGRRNFVLRADGILAVVCPIWDDTPMDGIGIFNAPADEVVALMEEDPAVKAGILTYEVHETRSFPGDALP
jgi:hypothetical protein